MSIKLSTSAFCVVDESTVEDGEFLAYTTYHLSIGEGGHLDIKGEVAHALTDGSEKGYPAPVINDHAYFLTPLETMRTMVLPQIDKLFGIIDGCHSITLLIEGERYISRIKVSSSNTVKNNPTKRMGRVIWNYTTTTESGRLVSFVIATSKKHQHSKRNK